MKRVAVFVLALLASACGLPKSQQPATRAAACAARNQALTLGVWEFCDPSAAAQCGLHCAGGRPCVGQMICRARVTGNQAVCDLPAGPGENPALPVGECVDGHGACPPWWQCVPLSINDAGTRSYCVPGPPCDDSDAGAQ